ncbi:MULTISPECIES: sodium:proton exchanger [Micromonospora]|uniref:Sodium:proton exchanger n=1 Tax=Micromonospora sicca TaxID=2202420 RepID=A0A317DMN9_9ACTN|nr:MULTISPECIES: sodium:proton exchanger [unclassified Micromonospora]MBM0228244.1 sodium:proton exchanger [Micromonospora sp. ATA51]PWR15878.1 sodium:proton exchanger [Micromonospora sp. 4G51]
MGAKVETTVTGRGAGARIALALAVAAPAVIMRLAGVELAPVAAVAVFGAAVLASVALLMWASEAARVDISGSLALAILALMAILPEYAVDIFFAYTAGHDPAYAAYAAANMTGANRLLIGVAWPLLVVFAIVAVRHRGVRGERNAVTLQAHRRTEILFLAVATSYALVIPLTGRLAWYDSLVLAGLFAAYLWRLRGKEEAEEELAGVAATIAVQPATRRRGTVAALFVAAGMIILATTEPFGDALVGAGAELGIDEFLLVQWLAPIASEAPEVIVAITFALRGRADDGMGALLAAKLNQWTLLIACLPVAYYLGGGEFAGLPLDARQTEELVLTTAQTLLGVAVLTDLRLTRSEATLLFGLFAVQFVLPAPNIRYVIAVAYTVLAIVLFIRQRRHLPELIKSR